MGADGKNAGTKCRPWFGLFIGIATVVLANLRGAIPGYWHLQVWLDEQGVDPVVRSLDEPLLFVVGAWLGARLAMQDGSVLRALGLRSSPLTGVVFGLVAGIPMIAVAALHGSLQPPVSALWYPAVAMFADHLLFIGLLVVMPVTCGRMPFWPCALLSGIAGASPHVPWSSFDAYDAVYIAVTVIYGVWFAWLCRSYGFNLWVPIVLQVVMVGSYEAFGIYRDRADETWLVVGRGLTIALATVLAVRHSRRAGATKT